MTTLQTADGRLLRPQGPSNRLSGSGGLFPSSFPPLWSDGERYPNGLTDNLTGVLTSYEEIYRSQPVLAGVVDLIATRASTLPFGAFTVAADLSRKPIDRSDSLATLLRRPRPRAATVHLLNHIFTSLLVHGNAVVAKVRGNDRSAPPEMLWPLDWSMLSGYGEVGGDIEFWSTTQIEGQEFFIAVDDTVHFAWPSPSGGQIGVSPLEKLGVTIKLEDAAQRYQTANFRNGNRASNVISFPQELKGDALARTRDAVEALHKGVDRAGRTMILSGGATIAPLSMSPVEAALVDQRRLDREEVAIVFGLSGPSLTDSTNSALGNVAERFRAFYRDVLPPWLTLVCESFESQLIDPEPAWMDRVCRFELTDKLRGEPLELAESLKLQVEAGILTRNEARYLLGMPPDKDPNASKLTAAVNNQGLVEDLNKPTPGAPAPVLPTRSETRTAASQSTITE